MGSSPFRRSVSRGRAGFSVLHPGLRDPAWAGFDQGVAAYERGDYATALREYRPLAERGDAKAQYFLGFMYREGQGVPEDYAEAVKWYRKAAEQGVAVGQFNLCRVHETIRMTPAMALGVADHIWTIGVLIEAALGDEGPKPEGRRVGPFRVIEGGK